MVWGVESCSFVNITAKPEGLTSVKLLIVLLKTFKFCVPRMPFKSWDKMLSFRGKYSSKSVPLTIFIYCQF
jgi:hypothetical protein